MIVRCKAPKALESRIRLAFITGVSKFSRVSIFSELNNLTDLTLCPSFATALGLTEVEIQRNLAAHITAFAVPIIIPTGCSQNVKES